MTRNEQRQIATTCPYCGVGCGVRVTQEKPCDSPQAEWQTLRVNGLTDHPANFGKLCVKGSALHETIDHDGRLLQPIINGQESNWSTALDHVADKIRQVIDEHGPEAVAFYGSGQLLTEDYYVANKLMKGFIGSANMDTNSRLCMASAVVAHKRAFGSDTVPGCYEDIDLADLIILQGSNAAWTHPIVYQRIVRAKQARPELKVVVIDPRKTATCDIADLHLAIQPGTDGYLFNGLLSWLAQNNQLNTRYIQQYTEHFDEALQQAHQDAGDIDQLCYLVGVNRQQMLTFFQWFASTDKTVTLFCQGINQHQHGSDHGNAIINAHLATGRIGRPGSTPFSLTGQPNAMGGREVGGLANQLAAHIEFSQHELVQAFWQSPTIAQSPGLKAIDLFDAMAEGRIKLIWIMATNPVVSLPHSARVREALSRCETVIVSDCMAATDTTAFADVLLPSTTWGEKDGTVTNSERRISRQRSFLTAPGEAKADWWIICQVAQRMGFQEAFAYQQASDIFREHAQLSAYHNNGQRDFDLSGLCHLSEREYHELKPIQWPVNDRYPHGCARLFTEGQFYTASAKAQFVTVSAAATTSQSHGRFILNTGRVRDQWHTMTRTAKSPRLANHRAQPQLMIHPNDAAALTIDHGQLVRVHNAFGEVVVRAELSDDCATGQLFLPMHWNRQFANRANVGHLIPSDRDPHSGQPQFKYCRVDVEALTSTWQGLIFSRQPLPHLHSQYWSHTRTASGWRYELSHHADSQDWIRSFRHTIGQGHWLTLSADQQQHGVYLDQQRIECAYYVGDLSHLDRNWIQSQCDEQQLTLDNNTLQALLAGKPAQAQAQLGNIICSCAHIGDVAIKKSIRAGAQCVTALGQQLGCGTHCGSCIPELRTLLDTTLETST